MNAKPRPQAHRDLKDISITIKSMAIENMSVDPSLDGHQIRRQR